VKKVTRRVEKVNAEVVGLDVHASMVAYCVLNRRGDELESGEVRGDRESVMALLARVVGRKKSHVTLEASGSSLWLYDEAAERYGAERVHLAHAFKVQAIANSRSKNDANDAFWLAYLTHEGRLPEAYMPQGAYRELRIATRERMQAVQTATKAKVVLKGHLRQMGDVLARSSFDSDAVLKKVAELAWRTGGVRGQALLHGLKRLKDARQEEAAWNVTISELAKELPEVGLLASQLPGIGPTLAATIVAETGPIRRFHSPKALSRYTGLTPTDRSTGGKVLHGGISREGSAPLRWALMQAVTICMRMTKGPGAAVARWIKSREMRMRGRNKAKVAAAHKMATAIWRLVHIPEGFDAAKPFGGVPEQAMATA
jgi:transposase